MLANYNLIIIIIITTQSYPLKYCMNLLPTAFYFFPFQSPIEPLLPQLLNHTSLRNKSACRSTGSFLLEDGQLSLPKTFVTRKGAIILFTPSEDICTHANGESHLKKENVYEAGVKLRTLGNLANSVLEFGKEVSL